MRIHQLSVADAIASVHSTPHGLSSDETAQATAPISAQVWLFVVPFGVFLLTAEELRKWLPPQDTA